MEEPIVEILAMEKIQGYYQEREQREYDKIQMENKKVDSL